jgi:hypothetical protein
MEQSSGSSEMGMLVFHRPYRPADRRKLNNGRPVRTQSLLLLTFLGKFHYVCQELDKMTTVNISCRRIHTRFKLHCIFSLVIEKYLDTKAQWNIFTVFCTNVFRNILPNLRQKIKSYVLGCGSV